MNGGGVQSAAIVALIVLGKLTKPDYAIIVDTEYEQSTTWEYLDNIIAPALRKKGLKIDRVNKSDFATVDVFG